MPREKSVGVIIYRVEPAQSSADIEAGKKSKILFLLLQYREKHWDFVKGHQDTGETEKQTLRREAKEEAGIGDLKIIDSFKEYTKYFFKQYKELILEKDKKKGKIPWIFKIVIFYLAQTKTKEIKLSWEHQDYKWLPYKEALKQITYNGSKEILKKANAFLGQRNE